MSQTAVTPERKGALALTENARTVLSSRYLKKDEEGVPVETPEELFMRVAESVAGAETRYGLSLRAAETVRDEFYRIMAEGKFMPNSPTLMNAGRPTGLLSACFVLPVEDSVDSIFSSIRHTALIQKAGGGTGFDFSRLRPKGDRVASSGGVTSGPISFMKVFGTATDAIQQGAFRRGANMGILRVDHPDIVEFIGVKRDLSQLANFNLSVALTDAFMAALRENPEREHAVRNPRTGQTTPLVREDGTRWTVGEIFNLIIRRAWETGEPGVLFIDRINEANPTPHVGRIEATNPCGEQPLLPYESCNLGSINLSRFVMDTPEGRIFDFDGCRSVIHLATRFLDDIIDINKYPIPQIEEMSRGNRKIGLGVMGFADALYGLGIPYNSEEGVRFGGQVMEFVNEESHQASRKLAETRGPFPNWKGSEWDQRGIPMRNACTTTVAPTGTISIIANCSSGIEPLFSLVFFRNVLDGRRLAEVNSRFEAVARERGFHSQALLERIAERGTIQDMTKIPEDVRRVFVTAHDIAPEWHIRMQAAFQRHCDASISKTINFPAGASEADVRNIYLMAFEERCKGVTVYRDGCRKNQPMDLKRKDETAGPAAAAKDATVQPVALPDIMPAIRIRQLTPFGNMHVKIVVDPVSGREREVFAQLGKGGDLACSDLEAICRLVSLYLRVNGSLQDILNQLRGIGSSLSISTKDGRIVSLADGLAVAIQKYLDAKETFGLEALLLCKADILAYEKGLKALGMAQDREGRMCEDYKIKCPECGEDLVFEEGCTKCAACGYSKC